MPRHQSHPISRVIPRLTEVRSHFWQILILFLCWVESIALFFLMRFTMQFLFFFLRIVYVWIFNRFSHRKCHHFSYTVWLMNLNTPCSLYLLWVSYFELQVAKVHLLSIEQRAWRTDIRQFVYRHGQVFKDVTTGGRIFCLLVGSVAIDGFGFLSWRNWVLHFGLSWVLGLEGKVSKSASGDRERLRFHEITI